MAELKFTFEKPYDEVTINERKYKLYYDDESLEIYQKQAEKYSKKSQEHIKKLEKDMTEQEREKVKEEGLEFMKDFVETFYGEGAYEEFYEESGKSMINFIPLVEFTFEWLQKKTPDVSETKKNYYTKKRKK